MHRGMEITLQSQICRVRAVVVFNAKLLNFFDIRIENIFTKFAFWIGKRNMFYLSIYASISEILLDVKTFLP